MTDHSLRCVLVTGGAGFIGSNFIRHLLRVRPGVRVVNYDALTYAGNLESVADLAECPDYTFVRGDIGDAEQALRTIESHGVETVINFAAESHVDRSILSGAGFITTNVAGTQALLEAARRAGVERFVQISTDEVYGSLGPDDPPFTEQTPLAPNNPYSASKAGADLVARAYFHTHNLPVLITRCSNNYGPYQFPEKLIPLMTIKALAGEPLPVYGDGRNVRDWIHTEDHCAAILAVAERGRLGEVYNIGSDNEWANIDIVRAILRHLGQSENLIRLVKDRPGHDRRYAMGAQKLERELGWRPSIDFKTGLARTIDWYVANEPWWRRVMTGEYQKYYEANYAGK